MKIIVLSLLILSSCGTLKDIDRPVCVELNISKGYCTSIVSGKDQVVDDNNLLNGKTWFEQRNQMIMVPVETWAALKKYLLINCKRSPRCYSEMATWRKSIQTVDGKLVEKGTSETSEESSP